jgi:hypothetical protein
MSTYMVEIALTVLFEIPAVRNTIDRAPEVRVTDGPTVAKSTAVAEVVVSDVATVSEAMIRSASPLRPETAK